MARDGVSGGTRVRGVGGTRAWRRSGAGQDRVRRAGCVDQDVLQVLGPVRRGGCRGVLSAVSAAADLPDQAERGGRGRHRARPQGARRRWLGRRCGADRVLDPRPPRGLAGGSGGAEPGHHQPGPGAPRPDREGPATPSAPLAASIRGRPAELDVADGRLRLHPRRRQGRRGAADHRRLLPLRPRTAGRGQRRTPPMSGLRCCGRAAGTASGPVPAATTAPRSVAPGAAGPAGSRTNLRALGVDPITSSVGHPQTCGKDERRPRHRFAHRIAAANGAHALRTARSRRSAPGPLLDAYLRTATTDRRRDDPPGRSDPRRAFQPSLELLPTRPGTSAPPARPVTIRTATVEHQWLHRHRPAPPRRSDQTRHAGADCPSCVRSRPPRSPSSTTTSSSPRIHPHRRPRLSQRPA